MTSEIPGLVERVARAICEADSKAPKPDALIMIGMKRAKAWEGRIPQAEAAIKEIAADLAALLAAGDHP